ncbi:MAG: protein kinase, partial [Vicinamibacterales bacterium]
GVKLLDFGLAKLLPSREERPDSAVALTDPHQVMGTPQYMSPEQIQGQPVDARSDIFSFGCVVYELITGRRPFVGASPVALMNAIVALEPAPMNTRGLPVPARVEAVVMRCLMKDPHVRWQTAREVAEALKRTTTEREGPPPVPSVGMAGWIRHRAPAIAATIALAWLAVTAALRLFSGSAPPAGVGARHATGALRVSVQAGDGWRRDAVSDTFAVSGDGASIAFSARRPDGRPSIWTRRFSESPAKVLPGSDGGIQPFWSSDATQVAFFRERTLVAVDVATGRSRVVTELPGAAPPAGGSWLDTRIVFALEGRGLFAADASGGSVRAIAGSEATSSRAALRWPQILPYGQHLIAFAPTDVGGSGISLLPVVGGEAMRLVQSVGAANYASGALFYPRVGDDGGRQILQSPFDLEHLRVSSSVRVLPLASSAVAGGAAGFSAVSGVMAVQPVVQMTRQLQWADRTGHDTEPVGRAAPIEGFALAPDGQRIAATIRAVATGAPDLWLIDHRRGEQSRLTMKGAVQPLWSADGRRIYFTSPSDRSSRLVNVETGEESPFVLVGPASSFEDVTRDGRYLVLSTTGDPSEIWLQRTDDPSERRTLVREGAVVSAPRVSPNGKWLAFTMMQNGRRDVFVQPFDRPGTRVHVSESGGDNSVWRDDSRELFYEVGDALLSVSIGDDRGLAIVGAPAPVMDIRIPVAPRSLPRSVATNGRGPRFLVNTVVGDTDNAPIDVSLNWTPAR